MELRDQDKNWTPHICCGTCYVKLINWWNGKGNFMLFEAPTSRRESKYRVTDCYFCMTNVQGFTNRKSNKHIVDPNLPSEIRPVLHSVNDPVPSKPVHKEIASRPVHKEIASRPVHKEIDTVGEDSVGEGFPSSEGTDPTYHVKGTLSPYLLTQTYLNDLVRDLDLSKQSQDYQDPG
ncbi:hypothetical protein PR048_024106 [Dryococelus australis]|uniref:Uncharacterized protein n=1 Tax=Dryococelus australis TaxID=614101 RepID=A0ABQ9GVZ5_9NEOP|nr:hypothetical protein PR048_024106 [Dryococelus australis]